MTAPSWAADPVGRNRTLRNAESLPRYAEIEARAASSFQGIVARIESKEIGSREASALMRESLLDFETEAFVAGRRARGVRSSEFTDGEIAMLADRNARQMEFFDRFAGDVVAGRGRMDYADRAELYAKGLWSLYTRGESHDWNGDDPGEGYEWRFLWHMEPGAEHCGDCRKRLDDSLKMGGFTYDEIAARGWPGENTICGVNCRCHVERVKKRIGAGRDAERNALPRVVTPALTAPLTVDLPPSPEPPHDLPPSSIPAGMPVFQAPAPIAVTFEPPRDELRKLLGGAGHPVLVPAQGLPAVRIPVEAVDRSLLQAAPEDRPMIERALPIIPDILRSPERVVPIGRDVRAFAVGPLAVVLRRNPVGLWEMLTALYVGDESVGSDVPESDRENASGPESRNRVPNRRGGAR